MSSFLIKSTMLILLITTLLGPIQVSAQCSSQFPNAWWFCGRVISSQEGSPVKMTDCSLRRTNDCGSDEQNLGPFPTCCKESVKPNIDGSVSCELANKDCH
ncbi:hypothetical protein PGT21_007121 [Puccinia graminis f. sp. tritici]|uniref:Single domain-containing protein n=1 Tax=Puccinia graminis f. sp. tritici TaxID=56615 RepID=A0A5B0P408_PUCGR|nr:hypothetical protein PGT21_007121 [Puccinia graminis f. sp. tritici]KAA1104933.1 hypothetical protein PGTUg99_013893 [Puccinia graminis f. sp. tritici]